MTTSSASPIEEAKLFYGERFQEMVKEFLSPHRYLYSGDDFFVLAYPHVKESLLRQSINKTLDEIDTWVIHFFSGDMKRLFDIAPFELEWVAFHRHERDVYKFYRTEKLKRRICNGKS